MNCSVCGGDTTPKYGISKKNGKPYSGHKCNSCGNMDFDSTTPQAQIIKPKPLPSNEPQILKLLLDIIRRQDEMKVLLESMAYPIVKGNIQKTIEKPSKEEPF